MNDDQKEEIEILTSIYPEELEVLTEDSYSVHLNIETDPPATVLVEVKYPPEYPDVLPILKLSMESQPELDENDRRFKYTFTTADLESVRKAAIETAEENLGMPLVFTVLGFIKEQFEDMYDSKIKEMEAQRIAELNLEEEKEQAKFRGTKVTKESFNKWRDAFRAEMGLDKPKERINNRLTGKEFFALGLYKEEDDDDELEVNTTSNAVST